MKRIFLSLCMLTGLQACQNSDLSDLQAHVNSVHSDKKPEIEPLPEVEPYQPFEYDADPEQDPFDQQNIGVSKKTAKTYGEGPDTNRRKEELENYPLDALRVVGTMDISSNPWVVVQTSNGIVHRATIGNYMGQNDGKIVAISPAEQKVVISEPVLDPRGHWVNKNVELTVDDK